MYLTNYIEKQPLKGRMRCKMNMFTVLRSPISGMGHKEGKIDSLKEGFLDNSMADCPRVRQKVRQLSFLSQFIS